MIDEKKLLCAFIYSAYESGHCGLTLGPEVLKKHMAAYSKFLSDNGNFPQKEIDETEDVSKALKATPIRDYVYLGHIDIVKSNIERDYQMPFNRAVLNPQIFLGAFRCPATFYKVAAVKTESVVGINLYTDEKRELKLLDGLERPAVGEVVSGHWNDVLEVVPDNEEYRRYRDAAKTYTQTLLSLIRSKK